MIKDVKTILLVGVVSFLNYVSFILSGGLAGAGHGTAFFGNLFLAPFLDLPGGGTWYGWLGCLFWLVVSALLLFRHWNFFRILAAVFLLVHYTAVTRMYLNRASDQDDWSHVHHTYAVIPEFVLAFLSFYLISQFLMWYLILSRSGPRPQPPSPALT
jgi:hypothetical protein